MQFMRDPRNVMLCVEQVGFVCSGPRTCRVLTSAFDQCGDAATMSTLGKCREIDPKFQRTCMADQTFHACVAVASSSRRTILVRTKLDEYYTDLTWLAECAV